VSENRYLSRQIPNQRTRRANFGSGEPKIERKNEKTYESTKIARMQNLGHVRRIHQRADITNLARVMFVRLKRRAKHAARTELPVAEDDYRAPGWNEKASPYQEDELRRTISDVLGQEIPQKGSSHPSCPLLRCRRFGNNVINAKIVGKEKETRCKNSRNRLRGTF